MGRHQVSEVAVQFEAVLGTKFANVPSPSKRILHAYWTRLKTARVGL